MIWFTGISHGWKRAGGTPPPRARLDAGRLEPLAELAHHQGLVQRLLFREAGGVDRLEAGQKLTRPSELGLDRRLRGVRQPVVPALVTQVGGELGAGGESGFPML